MIGDNDIERYLPYKTLFKKNIQKEETLETVQTVCKSLNANLKRCKCKHYEKCEILSMSRVGLCEIHA